MSQRKKGIINTHILHKKYYFLIIKKKIPRQSATECKKRQLAVSGSKQQLIDRLQPFEHQIMLQQQKDSFILFNEEKMMKKKKNCVVVVDNNNIGESGGGGGGGCCCFSPSVIDAVIDSVIDGSGLTEERNLNSNNKNTKLDNKRCSNINKIKKESKIMMLKNNKQKRNGTSKITKQKDIFTLGNCNLIKKSKMIINGRWQSFLGNNLPPKENLSNVGCKCCSCGYNNNNSILKNKKMENNEECLENEVKSTENEVEEEEDKMEELKEEEENEEINEEESYKLEENQQSLENSRTFSFAQMGSGGQFTPLEPADISIVISENNKNCNNTIVEKKIVKEENLKQHVQNNFNNSKTFLEIPKTINNKRINLLSTDKQQQNIKNSNNNYCCQQCCCSPFPYLPPSLPSTSPCLDVCVPSLDNQQHQKQQQNEQNTCCFQQKHKVEQKQHLSAELVREENNNINNSKNTTCFYCVEEENLKQQTCFSENEQILSAATLSKHEEFLRQQQQKIAELQRELALSQIALQKHQQMLAEARQASQPRDPETGIVFGQVEYWLGQLINTHKEQQLTLQRQIIGQRTLVYTEQKLQEELHTEQAVQDICRLIGQESKTALLIVQLLRRYQLERSVNNDVVTQPHSENLINIQEEKEETETLSLTKIKRKNAKKQEKNQNATNNSNIKRKGGGGRSKSALEGLINSTKEEKIMLV
ncbi:SAP domain-containing protein [Meloidogyne graminicola]|uniref:SAP domain-containing protein n=1 Tax=Meloidogyne graminicola TaxID=189291 RepID=A0A8S9ZQU1_9BILA|nr:SAP domain-containing protein [Meloidogyne graminicola]